jgi:hypothetical protein
MQEITGKGTYMQEITGKGTKEEPKEGCIYNTNTGR